MKTVEHLENMFCALGKFEANWSKVMKSYKLIHGASAILYPDLSL